MQIIVSNFTVLFEDPFWIGLFELECENEYSICKIVFGSEPKDYDVYDFVLKKWNKISTYKMDNEIPSISKNINPKRMRRMINKQLQNTSIGTKAQRALKLQHEQNKKERKTYNREKIKDEKDRKFNLKQQKRKQKHRGH